LDESLRQTTLVVAASLLAVLEKLLIFPYGELDFVGWAEANVRFWPMVLKKSAVATHDVH
jgi:hypothetical protein